MADWPVGSVQNPAYGFGDDLVRSVIRSDFDGGYAQTRPRYTRAGGSYSLEWPLMPEAMFQLLYTFANSNAGGSFNWWHPVSSAQIPCRFADPDRPLRSWVVSPGFRRVATVLERV